MAQSSIRRTCISDNKVTDIFIEPCTRKEFEHYKVELENKFGGCYSVQTIGKNEFAASFLIMGEASLEICKFQPD